MAAKRGKSQARRNNGGGGESIPGWAWLVLGGLLTFVVIVVGPKYWKGRGGDGFFRPQPNPDARPAPVAEDEPVAPEDSLPTPRPRSGKGATAAAAKAPATKEPEYEFYELLPGKEVPLSDAEIAASERAEAQREAARRRQGARHATEAPTPLPKPVEEAPAPAAPVQVAAAPASATGPNRRASADTSAPADDSTRYLLQAGAFQASGQAEEMKARIALLGLGARVEAAQVNGKTIYRVRMGPYGTAGDLADAKRKLTAGGLSAMAIKVN